MKGECRCLDGEPELDQCQAVFGGVLHDGRLGAQRLELGRGVAHEVVGHAALPQLEHQPAPLDKRDAPHNAPSAHEGDIAAMRTTPLVPLAVGLKHAFFVQDCIGGDRTSGSGAGYR